MLDFQNKNQLELKLANYIVKKSLSLLDKNSYIYQDILDKYLDDNLNILFEEMSLTSPCDFLEYTLRTGTIYFGNGIFIHSAFTFDELDLLSDFIYD